MTESSMQGFLDRSERLGGRNEADDDDLPVFIAQALIEQAVERVITADTLETGGILLGRLHRDVNLSDGVFLEITAQIPARHTEEREMQVTFTQQTWAAARDALALRRSDEQIIGWFHSHPDFCARCAPEKRAACALSGIFFSSADCSLHHSGALFLAARRSGVEAVSFAGRSRPAARSATSADAGRTNATKRTLPGNHWRR
jgi:proteasome lid subunit RPN8/RPN11